MRARGGGPSRPWSRPTGWCPMGGRHVAGGEPSAPRHVDSRTRQLPADDEAADDCRHAASVLSSPACALGVRLTFSSMPTSLSVLISMLACAAERCRSSLATCCGTASAARRGSSQHTRRAHRRRFRCTAPPSSRRRRRRTRCTAPPHLTRWHGDAACDIAHSRASNMASKLKPSTRQGTRLRPPGVLSVELDLFRRSAIARPARGARGGFMGGFYKIKNGYRTLYGLK